MAKRPRRGPKPTIPDDADAFVSGDHRRGNHGAPRGLTKDMANITPEDIEKIAAMWLKGYRVAAIARALNRHYNAIDHHVRTFLVPQFRTSILSEREIELAKIDNLERVAWEKFESKAPAEVVHSIKEGIPEGAIEGGGTGQGGLSLLEKTRRKITREGHSAWLDIVRWCIEQRCKIMGHYAAQRHEVSVNGEFRVAGMTPDQVDQRMMERMAEIIESRDRVRAMTATGGTGGFN